LVFLAFEQLWDISSFAYSKSITYRVLAC